jgi:hypothetical protein
MVTASNRHNMKITLALHVAYGYDYSEVEAAVSVRGDRLYIRTCGEPMIKNKPFLTRNSG